MTNQIIRNIFSKNMPGWHLQNLLACTLFSPPGSDHEMIPQKTASSAMVLSTAQGQNSLANIIDLTSTATSFGTVYQQKVSYSSSAVYNLLIVKQEC